MIISLVEAVFLHRSINLRKLLQIFSRFDEYDEDKYLFKAMDIYGIDNVRGGCFSSLTLAENDRSYIEKRILGASDRCYNCKSRFHFVRECPEPRQERRFRNSTPLKITDSSTVSTLTNDDDSVTSSQSYSDSSSTSSQSYSDSSSTSSQSYSDSSSTSSQSYSDSSGAKNETKGFYDFIKDKFQNSFLFFIHRLPKYIK